jgi:catechol 2,3-dioxygenase-like lactoylglutathione lyase family enzyme
MGQTPRFDHLGITVADLDVVTEFFVALGLEVGGRMFVEGQFIDTVCGIPGSKTEIVGLNFPGGGTWLELARFIHPDHTSGSPGAMANELGIRNVGLEVDDIEATVALAAGLGYGLVGGIGEYEGTWKQAYIRGPEGLVVSVAERIG